MGNFPGKTSKRRPCQVSRVEEGLRWSLALGKITMREFNIGMKAAGLGNVTSKDIGRCDQCADGLWVCPNHNYKITCRITGEVHNPGYTCEKFRE